nr:hypothetical protein [Trichocoleus desertorum]
MNHLNGFSPISLKTNQLISRITEAIAWSAEIAIAFIYELTSWL